VHFLEEYGTHVGDIEMFKTELRQRFAATPQLAGYWLVLEGDGPLETKIVGHICCWVNMQYGRPYVLVFQTEIEHQQSSRDVIMQAVAEAGEWVAILNGELGVKGAPLITYFELWTPHPPEVWARLLPELPMERALHVLRFGAFTQRTELTNGRVLQ